MAILQEVDKNYFMDRFRAYDRQDQFSYEGLSALYDYYDELSEEPSEDIKLDVIAICCDWAEYTPQELLNNYDYLLDTDNAETLATQLDSETHVIRLDNGSYLIQAF